MLKMYYDQDADLAGFDILVEAGYQPKIAYKEDF